MSEIAPRSSCGERTVYILNESTLETETSPDDGNGFGEDNDDTVDRVERDGPGCTFTLEVSNHLDADTDLVVACDQDFSPDFLR